MQLSQVKKHLSLAKCVQLNSSITGIKAAGIPKHSGGDVLVYVTTAKRVQ